MRDLLPENGASAVAIRDPQAEEPMLLADCSGPKCHEQVFTGDDQAIYDNESGLWFCSAECYVARKFKRGDIEKVVA